MQQYFTYISSSKLDNIVICTVYISNTIVYRIILSFIESVPTIMQQVEPVTFLTVKDEPSLLPDCSLSVKDDGSCLHRNSTKLKPYFYSPATKRERQSSVANINPSKSKECPTYKVGTTLGTTFSSSVALDLY